jgi:hypothetical protein
MVMGLDGLKSSRRLSKLKSEIQCLFCYVHVFPKLKLLWEEDLSEGVFRRRQSF